MANNLRDADTCTPDIEAQRRAEIAAEAYRQMENCLYTSTMLYMWLRVVRWQHKVVVSLPIVLTAAAGVGYVKDVLPASAVALLAFVATLIPSLAKALDIQTHVETLKSAAAGYKTLQDRFRQLAKITTLGDPAIAHEELSQLMDRMDVVRSTSITPPEKYYERASRKIKRGDYDFTIDIALRDALEEGSVKPLPAYT